MISRTQTIGLMMLALASLSVLAVISTVQQASADHDQRATCENRKNVIGACVQAQVSGLCVGILNNRQECPSE
ncbi:MAG: hypothetical protein M3275_03415 [Thermoproteota archaeon]|nr:hypothetical protein [Thermoproteota archaeon]